PSPAWQIATGIVAVFAPSFPINMRIRRRMMREAARPILLVGFIWFGCVIYLLLGALISQLAVAFGANARETAEIAAAASLAAVAGGLLTVARGPVVKRVRVPLARLPVAEYRIAHLTDVHVGPLIGRRFIEQVVNRVNALEPDLIVITGDLIDGPLSELRD